MSRSTNPQDLLRLWQQLRGKPFGKRIFSRIIGRVAPYTGTIRAEVLEFSSGHARVQMRDRKRLRNHLNSIHAVALINLGEVTTGIATMSLVPAGGRGIVTGLSMEYRKKSRGTITCECHTSLPPGTGSLDAIVEGILRDQSGDTVAIARAEWRLEIP